MLFRFCHVNCVYVGCRAARRTGVKRGENAVVFGCGTIGIASVISLKYFGCNKVMICDFSDFRLGIAKQLGFETCNTSSEDFVKKAGEFFGLAHGLNGEILPYADIYIDAAGANSIFEIFMKYGKIGSRIVMVAVNNQIRDLDLLHLTYAQKAVIGSGGYMPEDVCDVMEIMKSGRWDTEKIITHEFPLCSLPEAIKKASDTENAFNVVINFDM